ncbi:hypothetical protein GGF32_006326, partial [Allomyces javanicus]
MSGGYHLYCKYDPELYTTAGLFGAGVDIRNDSNGLIFGGEGYTHVKDMPNIEELPPAPAAFMERYRQVKSVVAAAPDAEDYEFEDAGLRMHDWICKEFGDISACRKLPGRIIVGLKATFCKIAGRKHRSNHQYLVLTRKKILYKCHDDQCKEAHDYEYTTEQFIIVNKMLEKSPVEMWETCNASDSELAKALLFMLEDMVENFDVVTVGKVFWYFNGTRWQSSADSRSLFEEAFDLMVARFKNSIDAHNAKVKALESKQQGDLTPRQAEQIMHIIAEHKGHIGALSNCISKVQSRNSEDRVLAELAARKMDNKFVDRLDTNPWLLGFDDCILDLQTKQTRPGRPDDFLSKSVGYKFPKATGRQSEIELVFQQLFPDAEVREYVTKVLAQSLGGHIGASQAIYFHKGSGSNGKSMLNKLMEVVLGEYYASVSAQRFSSTKDMSGSPDPELVRLRGCRYVGAQEPAKAVPMNSASLKQWTADQMKARDCKSNVIVTVKPMWRIHIYCNFLPFIDNDGGIQRRLRVVDYISSFTELAEDVRPEDHVYLADDRIIKRLESELLGDLFTYFLDRFDANWIERAPAAVTEMAQDFLADADPSNRFLKMYLEKGERSEFVLSKEIHGLYKIYCNLSKVHDVLGETNFHTRLATWAQSEKHGSFSSKTNLTVDGKKKSCRNVLRGWRLKENIGEDE